MGVAVLRNPHAQPKYLREWFQSSVDGFKRIVGLKNLYLVYNHDILLILRNFHILRSHNMGAARNLKTIGLIAPGVLLIDFWGQKTQDQSIHTPQQRNYKNFTLFRKIPTVTKRAWPPWVFQTRQRIEKFFGVSTYLWEVFSAQKPQLRIISQMAFLEGYFSLTM